MNLFKNRFSLNSALILSGIRARPGPYAGVYEMGRAHENKEEFALNEFARVPRWLYTPHTGI